MILSGTPERDRIKEEQEITKLVKLVRESESEEAFIQLQSFLASYISLFGKRYRIRGCDSEEIEQECLYALRYKAIEDFNPERGKFKSFAILCIKRHLFSLIKGNNQQKRRVLNQSLSLDEDRSEDGEHLSLSSIITENEMSVRDRMIKSESSKLRQSLLMSKLSKLEQEVFRLYIKQFRYDEIVNSLKKIFPRKKLSKKTVDNSLQRIRSKAQEMSDNFTWE